MKGRLAAVCGLIVLVAPASCALLHPPENSKLFEKVGRSNLSPSELRIRVRALAPRFLGEFEVLGDDAIAAAPGNLNTRMVATRFKINAIPAMQIALFQPDPVAALIDSWALLVQLQQGILHDARVDAHTRELAEAEFGRMEGEVERLWSEITGNRDVASDRQIVHDWAAKHPLVSSVSARESTATVLSNLTAREGVSALGAAASLMEDTADLSARLDLAAAILPKQARWQAEYLALEALTAPGANNVPAEADKLLPALVQLLETTSTFPSVLDRERAATLQGLRGERLGAQTFFDEQRQATMQDLRAERSALVEALRQERVATFADTDRMVERWGRQSYDSATALVDRTFRWLLLLTGLIVIGGLGALLLFLNHTRRSPSPREPRPLQHPA